MASLLTDEMLEEIGLRRVESLAFSLAERAEDEGQTGFAGNVGHSACQSMVRVFRLLCAAGLPKEDVIAALTMSAMRLGWGLAYDEIERDRAAVEALTEAE